MKSKYSYISILSTDNYLKGLLVLFFSYKKTKSKYPFLVLLTPNISKKTILVLKRFNVPYEILSEDINNPTDVDKKHRWFKTYSKLSVFNQTKYSKIVYLDADMLILRNIDGLFKYDHMSATNAGGMLPRKKSWTHLNSGLMVIEPSSKTFKDMISKIGKIETLESGGTLFTPKSGSDQDFLNSYYSKWKQNKKLHLDHKYNMIHYYLDEYHKLFGYSFKSKKKAIYIIHYASYLKPWNITKNEMKTIEKNPNREIELQSIKMWLKESKKIANLTF